jgi:uncharacterized protein (TIGR02466 family)
VAKDDWRASMTNEGRPVPGGPASDAALDGRARRLDTSAEALIGAAMTMADAGDLHGAIGRLRARLRSSPDDIAVLGNLGTLEQRLGRFREAEELFRHILTLVPDHASSLQCLANVLVLQDRYRSATPIYERLLRLPRPPSSCRTALCRCYLQEGRWAESAALCDQILLEEPYHAGLISMQNIARHELGESTVGAAELRALLSTHFLQPSGGYVSVEALNRDLVEHFQGRDDLVENPYDKTTRGGSQSGDLMSSPDACFQALGEAIKALVQEFLRTCSREHRGAYWERPVTGLGLTLWGTILGAGGHQEPHIHHAAWLSGVYYAQLPDSIRPDDPSQGGWIEFGRPPARYPCKAEYPLERVCPREGMLVLFPSYLFHRTIPLSGDATRVSFAFDVIAL